MNTTQRPRRSISRTIATAVLSCVATALIIFAMQNMPAIHAALPTVNASPENCCVAEEIALMIADGELEAAEAVQTDAAEVLEECQNAGSCETESSVLAR